jgi:hypothetical protein
MSPFASRPRHPRDPWISRMARWHFQHGRGVQEKIIGELKIGLAFASIPSQAYSANTAWQKLNLLTHNIATTFQLQTFAPEKPRSRRGLEK